MQKIILSYENNNLQYLCYEKTRQGIIEKNINYKELKEYLKYLSENVELIGQLKIEGNDLLFSTDKFAFKLLDYKDFKNKKRFSFVFKLLSKKKYKILKDKIIKGTAVGLAGVTILGISSNAAIGKEDSEESSSEYSYYGLEELSSVVKNEDNSSTTVYVDEDESYSNIDVNDFVLPSELNSKKEVITEKSTESQSVETNFDDKLESLCIGSACDDEKAIKTRELYYHLFEKYADKYGLDADLICAIATQERGMHSSEIDPDGAIGLMQIQVSVWNNQTISVYDYEQNEYKSIYITTENLKDVENNIEVGCAIFQNYLKQMNGNVIAAIQSYNNGIGTVNNIIRNYTYSCNKTINDVLESNDLNWIDYRNNYRIGDNKYLEHVLRYYVGNINNLLKNYSIKK